MNDNEEWRPVVGYEGLYEVSDQGRVRSLDREIVDARGRRRRLKGRGMCLMTTADGYRQVNLSSNNVLIARLVHHLVAEAFIGPRPQGYYVCHSDGSRTRNDADNLRYDTSAGNAGDKLIHGTSQRGEQNAQSKLTAADVQEIRRRCMTSSQKSVAQRFGLTESAISLITSGKRWGWLKSVNDNRPIEWPEK